VIEEFIVLVEDDPDDVFFTTHTLARHGVRHTVVVVNDGAAALNLLLPASARDHIRATLVLLDLNLPGMSGFEVLRQIRAEPVTSVLPVIAFISTRTDQDKVTEYSAPTGAIQKPLTFASFRTATAALGLPPWT
jgi:two-component system response regulator